MKKMIMSKFEQKEKNIIEGKLKLTWLENSVTEKKYLGSTPTGKTVTKKDEDGMEYKAEENLPIFGEEETKTIRKDYKLGLRAGDINIDLPVGSSTNSEIEKLERDYKSVYNNSELKQRFEEFLQVPVIKGKLKKEPNYPDGEYGHMKMEFGFNAQTLMGHFKFVLKNPDHYTTKDYKLSQSQLPKEAAKFCGKTF
jgi:hypothetical protein